jgi:hypothetical protein
MIKNIALVLRNSTKAKKPLSKNPTQIYSLEEIGD